MNDLRVNACSRWTSGRCSTSGIKEQSARTLGKSMEGGGIISSTNRAGLDINQGRWKTHRHDDHVSHVFRPTAGSLGPGVAQGCGAWYSTLYSGNQDVYSQHGFSSYRNEILFLHRAQRLEAHLVVWARGLTFTDVVLETYVRLRVGKYGHCATDLRTRNSHTFCWSV